MMLGDPDARMIPPAAGLGRATLDELFARVAQQRPDALALADPPNREAFTDGAPRRLSYAEADRVVAAIAGRLRRMGLPGDAIVAIQLPNVVESVLTFLGVLRAGMIAAPLPLLWRRAEAVPALARLGARALVTSGRVGAFDHGRFAMHAAAEVFCMRHVCAFGPSLPDGVVPFDELFADNADPVASPDGERQRDPAAHIAAVTWDVSADGLVPVARNHLELLAGGLAVALESRVAERANILSAIPGSSFAGICLTMLPWLLGGGALALHHGFDAAALARQQREDGGNALVVPAALVAPLTEAGMLGGEGAATIALWRGPERLALSPAWQEAGALVDVAAFGECGLHAARRGADGKPVPLLAGPVTVPRASPDAALVVELARTNFGTLALRGPMVPRYAFPPGAERAGLPSLPLGAGGFVDTGYACRVDPAGALTVTGPPFGIASVGGYRLRLRDLQESAVRLEPGAALQALPDPLLGQRLAGSAPDPRALVAKLAGLGLNPLVAAAFGPERGDAAVRAA
jgi:hypothetical protein